MKEKKWTVMFLSLNQTEKTFFIQNVGYTEEDFIKLFKLTKEQVEIFNRTYFNGFEKDISDNEFKALLQYCITNMDVLGVYRINNFYNRDQKVINNMKDNVRSFWIGKGYKEVIHCESPIVDTHGGNVFNKRDYLYLIEERIREGEEDLKYLENEYKLKEKNLENEYELKENNLNKELENNRIELEEIIENNKKKINQQNWYIDKTKEAESEYIKVKEKLDKEIDRYKKGKEYNDNMIKSLPIEIQELLDKKNSIENNISELNSKIDLLENKTKILENNKKAIEETIDKEKSTYKKIKNAEYTIIVDEIKKLANLKDWDKQETLQKFERTCKMYILNKIAIPEFEKEYAISAGLSEQEIVDILQKYL